MQRIKMAIEDSPYILILLMINRNKRKEKHIMFLC